jgi:uncharacterized BrkB/YihY/UPF0761 family membrane protein
MHEGGRAAPVEVKRARGPELDHHLRKLGHRETAVDARASAVAGNRDQPPLRDPERRARIAPRRDVGVELAGSGGEALAIDTGVEDDLAVSDEERPGLHQITHRPGRGGLALDESDRTLGIDDGGASPGPVRRGHRLMGRRPSVDPELTEGPVGVAEEEAGDNRLLDAILRAPDVQALGPGEMHDTQPSGSARVAHGVEGRDLSVSERLPPKVVLDPVLPSHKRREKGTNTLAEMQSEQRSRTAALAERLAAVRARGEALPGAPLVREVLQNERELGGGLIAGGVAFRIFLWLVPFGLVVAAVFSFWRELDPDGLETAARRFGVGAAAAQAAAEALEVSDRNAVLVLVFGLVLLAWFTLGAVRALVLAHALAWQLEPPRIRAPLRVFAIFNGLFLLAILSSVAGAWLEAAIGRTALLGTALALVVTTAIALYAMWLLPHRATDIRELLPGALLVAVGYELVQIAVIFYFAPRLGRSEETYGAFGAAATMLVWLYVLSRLVTVAAFLNATLWYRRHQAEQKRTRPR